MKWEDLFIAIGEADDQMLAASELTVKGRKPVFRSLLVAVMVSLMLLLAGCAAIGYTLFDSPREMLKAFFGDETGYDHVEGGPIYGEDGSLDGLQPTFERAPLNESVAAEDVEPYVSPVGQSISWKGYTLTVDSFMHDAGTGCGILCYTLENPEGIPYVVDVDGRVGFPGGDLVEEPPFNRRYIIQEKSTDTRLAAACYYHVYDGRDTELKLTLSQWCWRTMEMAIADQKWMETATKEEFDEWLANFPVCPDTITIPLDQCERLKTLVLDGGSITLSPISMIIDATNLEYLLEGPGLGSDGIHRAAIRFRDGSEYLVFDDSSTVNAVGVSDNTDGTQRTAQFNRIIDVDNVEAVILNDREFLPSPSGEGGAEGDG